MSNEIAEIDCLSLLALKIAPNIFDVSSGLHHISIRDQIVRARILVRDLKRADPKVNSILIVGCGAAGVSAALTAAECGMRDVVAVDVASKPFSLLSNVETRYVGPFMYEWPSSIYDNQSYPCPADTSWANSTALSALAWQAKNPCKASTLAKQLTENLTTQLGSSNSNSPAILLSVDKKAIKDFIKNYRNEKVLKISSALDFKSQCRVDKNFNPEYILLAAGMGVENCTLLKSTVGVFGNFTGSKFWENDELLSKKFTNKDTIIVGGGDGAMQDALRILTGKAHPLDYLRMLERNKVIKNLIRQIASHLLTADRQCRLYNSWSHNTDGYRQLDRECKRYASEAANNEILRRVVTNSIRKGSGSVSLFVRGGFFDKSYLLNRFIVHLINECCIKSRNLRVMRRMKFLLEFNSSAISFCDKMLPRQELSRAGKKRTANASVVKRTRRKHTVRIGKIGKNGFVLSTTDYHVDEIVVRYGIKQGTIPGKQMIQLSEEVSKQRTTLARVELPFVAGSVD